MYIIKLKNGQWILGKNIKTKSGIDFIMTTYLDVFNRSKREDSTLISSVDLISNYLYGSNTN